MTELALRNNFLIAMPALAETPFERTVTLLCEHNDGGALGLVINRPMDLDLSAMLEHLDLEFDHKAMQHTPVYWGGPVSAERGFVLHRDGSEWDSTLHLSSTLSLTSSRDILKAISAGEGPEQYMVLLGYAGWDGGQLERELGENSWLNTELDEAIVFDTQSDERWTAAASSLGIDPLSLSSHTGHA